MPSSATTDLDPAAGDGGHLGEDREPQGGPKDRLPVQLEDLAHVAGVVNLLNFGNNFVLSKLFFPRAWHLRLLLAFLSCK